MHIILESRSNLGFSSLSHLHCKLRGPSGKTFWAGSFTPLNLGVVEPFYCLWMQGELVRKRKKKWLFSFFFLLLRRRCPPAFAIPHLPARTAPLLICQLCRRRWGERGAGQSVDGCCCGGAQHGIDRGDNQCNSSYGGCGGASCLPRCRLEKRQYLNSCIPAHKRRGFGAWEMLWLLQLLKEGSRRSSSGRNVVRAEVRLGDGGICIMLLKFLKCYYKSIKVFTLSGFMF